MTRERIVRLVAGSFIIISLALSHYVDQRWLFFTLFVGVNLFQSALTKWCLMEDILKYFGIKSELEANTCCKTSKRIKQI